MDLRVVWPLFAGLSLFLAGCERPLNTATSPSNIEAFVVNDPRIEESSGLATAFSGDAFYTINDSRNEPEVYTMNRAGKVVSVTKVAGVRNIDWEDLGFQVIAGQPYLHIADVGDNSERRESIYIHRIPEKLKARTVQPITYQLRYPDGPHNCEAFFVDSTGGFTLITKSSKRAMIFYLALPRPGCVNELVSVGSINLDAPSKNARLVTGASISPSGEHVIVRTYLAAYEFDRTHQGFKWWESVPRKVVLPTELQGEAITYLPSGNSIATSSELRPFKVTITHLR